MALSFFSELKITLPEYTVGTARCQAINKFLAMNEAWHKEAYTYMKALLNKMHFLKASDMDLGGLESNNKVWFRIFGEKAPSDDYYFHSDEVTAFLMAILNDEQKIILFKNKNIDFSFEIILTDEHKPSRFRGDIYFARNSLVANFRRINSTIFPLENLQFPEQICKRFDLGFEQSGLYIITGITGSGKSTTLDSIVDMNNHRNLGHIIILGMPIEYVHSSDKCLIRHREMGEDVLSFAQGTYQALRQDPDIIVVGEMRNAETIATVMEVTDSGHKVFSTLHTSSAIESIHRIIGEFPSLEQDRIRMRLADVLKVIVSQKLVPDNQGRLTMVKEILSVNPSVQAAIRNGNISEIYQMMSEGRKYGMYTLEQDLAQKFKNGIITLETAVNNANNKKRLEQLLSYS